MNETWMALSSNAHAKTLMVKNLVPKWTTAFITKEFHFFLGRLESMSLTILTGDGIYGVMLGQRMGYIDFLGDSLGDIFSIICTTLRNLRSWPGIKPLLALRAEATVTSH
jgi:hypothetical protein